jgi:hypothetical protein
MKPNHLIPTPRTDAAGKNIGRIIADKNYFTVPELARHLQRILDEEISPMERELTSRDAILPVIEKHWRSLLKGNEPTLESEGFLVRFGEICEEMCHDKVPWTITPIYRFILMKPRQLAEALLRATNKWKD